MLGGKYSKNPKCNNQMINCPIKSYGSDNKELKYHHSTMPEIGFIVINRVKYLRVLLSIKHI